MSNEEEPKPKTLGGIDRSVTPFWSGGTIINTDLYGGLTAEDLNAKLKPLVYTPVTISQEAVKACTDERWIEATRAAVDRAIHKWETALEIDLLGLDSDLPPLTPEQEAEYERYKRKQKFLAPWYWLKLRIVGTYRVWVYGSSEEEENERDY